MHSGLIGGIVGSVVGLMGGAIGTYFAIRRTSTPRERAFAVKCAFATWIGVSTFLLLLFLTPAPYKWLVWLSYSPALILVIIWMNKNQLRIRAEEGPRSDDASIDAAAATPPNFSRMRQFLPRFCGEVRLPSVPDDFVARIEARVGDGLLVRGVHARSNYEVRGKTHESLTITAGDFWTATNIGLNEVHLSREGDDRVRYDVSYRRWTGYAVALGAIIFAPILAILAFARPLIDRWTSSSWELWGGFGIGVFFCLAWPWVLTELHKKRAAACLERILHESLGGDKSEDKDGSDN